MSKKTNCLRVLLLAVVFLGVFAVLVFYNKAYAYTAEVGENYISFDFNVVTCGIVNRAPTATYEKNVEIAGRTAVKFTPTPEVSTGGAVTLDCFTLANYGAYITVPDYKYVGITYYYDTESPSYREKMKLSILPGNTKATGNISANSSMPVVTKQWTEAYFSFGTTMVLKETEKPYINQIHFAPFGSKNSQLLKETDVIYVEKITFYKENPDPNAVAELEFMKGTPDALGDNLYMSFKPKTEVSLPKNPFVYEGAELLGWRSSIDGELYPEDYVISAADGLTVYTAVWDINPVGEYISLDYASYEDGIVNHKDTAIVKTISLDGRTVVKVTPNPESTQGTQVTLDGFSYGGVGIDLQYFKWVAVEYMYDSENPVDTYMGMDFLQNGGALTTRCTASSEEKIKEGEWTIALFDFTHVDKVLTPNLTSNELRQIHFRVFGSTKLENLSADEHMYLSRIMFFREKPEFKKHTGFMNGYEDATFRPGNVLSRAEAAAISARVYTDEDESLIVGESSFSDVGADKWYAKYIGFCQNVGIIKDNSENFFPERKMTVSEFADLVFNTMSAKSEKDKATVSLLQSDEKMNTETALLSYVNSLPDERYVTRAEAAIIVNRARGHVADKSDILRDFSMLFLDVDSSHWMFEELTEATVSHVTWKDKWVYPLEDPIADVLGKMDVEKMINVEEGNAKVAELDILEKKRIDEIRSSASMSLDGVTGDIYYVSPNGDDSNDGTSEQSPFKTIKMAISASQSGDAVLLERGGLWREKFTVPKGVTVSAYGTGDKPKVYGSPENGANPDKWTLVYYNEDTGARIWRYENDKMTDVGTLVLDGGEGFAMKEIPTSKGNSFVVRGTTDVLFDYRVELDKNFEFFHRANSVVSNGIINASTAVGPLYFRCDNGNPGTVFDSIEFNTKGNVVGIGGANVTIDNLCIMYGGSHGIGAGTVTNLTVTNCEVGWIGGSVQSYNANGTTDGRATRFGNGIEVYGGCNGYTIDNCYVYQCYDAGVTHQLSGRSTGNYEMIDVTYSNNLITECVYSIEYFFGAYTEDSGLYKRYGKGVLFDSNFMRRAGFGFGSFRPDGKNQRHIRSGSSENWFEDFTVKNNIFDRSVWELLQCVTYYKACVPSMENNTYIQGKENRVYTFGTTSATGYADILMNYNMVNVLKDSGGTFYYVDNIPYWEYTYTNPTFIAQNPAVYPETDDVIFGTA